MAGVQIDGVNNKIDFDDDLDTSISANTDDTLVIEAGGNTMATITATTLTINDGTTITTADNTDTLSLISTDADANIGPNLRLYRNSSSPADGDQAGLIRFDARNDNSQDFTAANIFSFVDDASDGTEDGAMLMSIMLGGTARSRIWMGSATAETVFNDDSQDIDFRVESNGNTHMFFVDGGNNKVGIGESANAPMGTLHIKSGDSGDTAIDSNNDDLVVENDDHAGITISTPNDKAGGLYFSDLNATASGRLVYDHNDNYLAFTTASSEQMRIHSDGNISIGRATVDTTNAGISLEAGGTGVFVRSGGPCVIANRLADDGEIIRIVQAGTTEGTISTSGSTVSYNAFTGSHWSRLADNSKPSILVGTIMESLDSMINWYQAVADVAEVKYTAEDQAVIDGDKNVGDVKTEAHTIKEEIALPDGKSVGDAVTFTHYGTEYTGVYAKENDVKHVHSKVSDLADSTRVYGVFHCWGNDNVADVNDMEIAQVGTYIIRVHKDITVAAGDLLVSNGDGTAKKQDDDIIRSKTVAKVNSNVKIETYSDGSYTVPCTLHC